MFFLVLLFELNSYEKPANSLMTHATATLAWLIVLVVASVRHAYISQKIYNLYSQCQLAGRGSAARGASTSLVRLGLVSRHGPDAEQHSGGLACVQGLLLLTLSLLSTVLAMIGDEHHSAWSDKGWYYSRELAIVAFNGMQWITIYYLKGLMQWPQGRKYLQDWSKGRKYRRQFKMNCFINVMNIIHYFFFEFRHFREFLMNEHGTWNNRLSYSFTLFFACIDFQLWALEQYAPLMYSKRDK